MLPLLISTSALFLSVASFSSSVAAAYLLLRERSMASGRSVAGKGKRGIEKREGTFVRSSRARHSASAEFLPDEEKAALSLSFSLLLFLFAAADFLTRERGGGARAGKRGSVHAAGSFSGRCGWGEFFLFSSRREKQKRERKSEGKLERQNFASID